MLLGLGAGGCDDGDEGEVEEDDDALLFKVVVVVVASVVAETEVVAWDEMDDDVEEVGVGVADAEVSVDVAVGAAEGEGDGEVGVIGGLGLDVAVVMAVGTEEMESIDKGADMTEETTFVADWGSKLSAVVAV